MTSNISKGVWHCDTQQTADLKKKNSKNSKKIEGERERERMGCRREGDRERGRDRERGCRREEERDGGVEAIARGAVAIAGGGRLLPEGWGVG